jgi:hypothetical protein
LCQFLGWQAAWFPSYGFRKLHILGDTQYMAAGWLVSAPMALKFCMMADMVFIHNSLLAFASPVPGFCAMEFLSNF